MGDDILGDWLHLPTGAQAFPEAMRDGLAPIADLADRFSADILASDFQAIEAGDRGALRRCLAAMGPLGLLGAEVPADRGGAELTMTECCRIVQALGPLGGFSVAYVAHAGLATIPLATYAGPALAETYLPRLLAGDWVGDIA